MMLHTKYQGIMVTEKIFLLFHYAVAGKALGRLPKPLCLLCLCVCLFNCALLRSPAGKGLTSWLWFVVYNYEFVTFPLGQGQVWYLIVLIPDLCTLSYFGGCLFDQFHFQMKCLKCFVSGNITVNLLKF